MKRWFWLIFLAPFLVYIPNLEKFAFITLSEYSDLLISHWPNAYFIHNAIFQMREFPLWTDAILGGYPLIANPLAGFWYPPNWLTFLFPYPITYNLLFFAHVFIGALAVYYILRDEEFSMEIAILGGVIFELMPKIWAHYAAGHISLVFSVCLTPLLLLVSRRALASEMKGKYLHLPGLVTAGIILADARWLVYALIVESFFLLYFLDMHSTSIHSSKKKISLYFFGEFLIGLLLSSILLIPLAEYISLSTRNSMTLRDNLIYSLPFAKTIYFIFPQIGGIAEWVIYLGGFGAIVLVLSLVNKQIRRKSIHWLILFLIAWLISISGSIPILSRLWELPGMSLIRVPSRVIFVCGISLCFLAAICLNELYNSRFNKRVTNLFLVGILAFSSLSFILSIFLTNGTKIGIQWGSLSLFVFSTILFIALNRSRLTKAWIYVMTGFVILDLAGVTFQSIRFLEFTKAVSTGESLLQSITQDPSSDFRIFTPSDSIPQQTAAFHQLEMANGIDPLQLKSYVKYFNFKEKDGTILEGYSVTLPPFITGHPRIDNIDLLIKPWDLGLLNVKYIFSAFPITEPGLNFLAKTAEGFVYQNLGWLPREWIQRPDSTLGKGILEVPESIRKINSIQIKTHEAGLLVLSEIMYPGWDASIDGKKVEIIPQAGILRSIVVPYGDHLVEFRFQPTSFYLGLLITCIALILIVFHYIFQGRKNRGRA